MVLLERGRSWGRSTASWPSAREGHGSLVLVGGEAGIGKTSLVGAFCDRHGGDARVLLGGLRRAADPAPAGPAARHRPRGRRGAGGAGRRRADQAPPVRRASSTCSTPPGRPVVAVVEDAHWADEATLDLLVFVGRRVAGDAGDGGGDLPRRRARARAPPADGHRRPGDRQVGPPPRAPGADQGGRGHAGRPAGDRPRPPAPDHRRQPVLRHRGARRRQRGGAADRARRRAGPRGPALAAGRRRARRRRGRARPGRAGAPGGGRRGRRGGRRRVRGRRDAPRRGPRPPLPPRAGPAGGGAGRPRRPAGRAAPPRSWPTWW